VAIETGIAPNDLIESPPAVLNRMVAILNERGEADRRKRLQERLKGAG